MTLIKCPRNPHFALPTTVGFVNIIIEVNELMPRGKKTSNINPKNDSGNSFLLSILKL